MFYAVLAEVVYIAKLTKMYILLKYNCTGKKPEQRKSHQSKRANTSHSRSKLDNKKNDKNKSTMTKQRNSNIAVLGDSMLKHLNPRRIQHGIDHKVTIKTFPGAVVDEMSITLDLLFKRTQTMLFCT